MTEQTQLFDPTRYSPVSVAVLQWLPDSNARAFVIASALGSIRDLSGSDAPLKSGKGAGGSLITHRRLPAILQACNISSRQWRRYVADWVSRYVAHRCGSGVVFLFAVPPFESGCPACRVPIVVDHIPPSWRHKGRGRNATQGRSRYGQFGGARTATGAARERPDFEPRSSTPERRVLQGVEEGGGLEVD
jgi:hypothetical protein